MSSHHTRRTSAAPSQIFPSAASKVASDVTLAGTYVGLCDWHGRVVWKSGTAGRLQIGDELWKNAAIRCRESLRTAVASVVTLRENRTLEVESDSNEHFRVWMWPLNDPDIALAILAIRIPSELALLTNREAACLRCLARGLSTRDVAKELGIGLTTVHTHLRRSREKLGLTTGEALVGFAARYFFVPAVPSPTGEEESAAIRRRSG
jgi:DNA-binding CsgD family transcriptional regulator